MRTIASQLEGSEFGHVGRDHGGLAVGAAVHAVVDAHAQGRLVRKERAQGRPVPELTGGQVLEAPVHLELSAEFEQLEGELRCSHAVRDVLRARRSRRRAQHRARSPEVHVPQRPLFDPVGDGAVDPVVVQVKVCAPENLQGARRLEAQSLHGGDESRGARIDLDEGALAAQQPLEPRDVLLDVRDVVVGRRLCGRLLRSEVLLGASPSHGQHLKSARGVAPSGPIASRAHGGARETGPGRAISQRTWSLMLRKKIAKSGKITRCRKGSWKTWKSTRSRKRTV